MLMRVRAIPVALAFVLTGLATLSADAQERQLRLVIGESQVVRERGTITRAVVANDRVADVRQLQDPREVLVMATGRGATTITLTVGGDTILYQVAVSSESSGATLGLVRQFLGTIEGIQTRIYGDAVVIEGDAMSADDYGRAQRAVDLFGTGVRNMVRVRPSAVEQVNRELRRNGLAAVNASAVGGRLFLEGSVGSPEEQRKLDAFVRALGLQVENLVAVGRAQMVEIAVDFLEVRRGVTNRIGIEWPNVIGASGTVGLSGVIPFPRPFDETMSPRSMNVRVDSVSGTPISLAINLLMQQGYGRLLAQPRLVCASGARAEFLSGGEIPIVTVTQNAVSVEFKQFGIKLETSPIADSRGNIALELLSEVSQVDESLRVTVGGTSIPGFRLRRARTSVTVRDGQTIVLSGLFSNDEQKAISRFPVLGHIPIIGELFRSRDFQRGRTNLLIFVTPRLVSPESDRIRQAIREMQQLYREAESDISFSLID